MTDASFTAAGFAIMIEDDSTKNSNPEGKLTPQLHLGQNHSSKHNSKCQSMRIPGNLFRVFLIWTPYVEKRLSYYRF